MSPWPRSGRSSAASCLITTDKGDDSEGERKVDRGVKTCPTCRGTKYTETSQQEQDGDGTYDGAGEHTCTQCNGTGTI
jgi:hypothetical protein